MSPIGTIFAVSWRRAGNVGNSVPKVPRGRPKSGVKRQQQLLSELQLIFLKDGFRAHKVDDLAKKLSCSKRTLYTIAASKEELFLLSLDNWLHHIRRTGWQRALTATDPRKRIQEFLQPGIEETINTSRKFWVDIEDYAPAAKMLSQHQKERMHSLEDMIQEGIDDGYFVDVPPYLIAEILLSSILRFDSTDFQRSSGLSISEAFDKLYQVVFRGIETNPQKA